MRGSVHDEIALRAPGLSLNGEDAVDPHLGGNGFDRGQAPEAAGPVPERGQRDFDVGRHQETLWADLEREGRAERAAPCLELGVQPLGIELMQIAQP